MNQNKIIITILASLIFGLGVSAAFQEYMRVKNTEKEEREAITENPFYDEFKKAGSRYGLNMEFTKKAHCVKSTLLGLEMMPLLQYGPKSCDILLVGDSSMAWGMIPEVIEQMTGLKMGVFASEVLFLNTTVARMIDNLASFYLKDNGLLIISFGGWTQEQDANSMVLIYSNWINNAATMNHDEFAAFMKKWKEDQLAGGGKNSFREMFSFSGYRNRYQSVKDSLATDYCMSLLQVQLYLDYIEPVVNPAWHRQKMEMKAKIQCYLRWNNRSIVMSATDIETRSHHSEVPYNPAYSNKNVAIVSALLKKIRYRKAYQIHISYDDRSYVKLRSIYNKYYRDAFGLIDLGREHPAGASYDIDMKEHTINTGGFYQSILIGSALKRDFTALGKE